MQQIYIFFEETGTHKELMEQKGEYYKLYNLYADVFSDKQQ